MNELVFNDIYKKYGQTVWKTAQYYFGDQMNADEITQLTFVKLLISYDEIRNKNAIEIWLLTTVRHQAYSLMRKLKKEMPMDDVELSTYIHGAAAGSEEVIFMREHRKDEILFTDNIMEELYQHNPRWHDALVRAYILEMPQKEIANEMGIRLEAFQSMLFRAKHWIQAKYEEKYKEMEE